MPTRKPSSTVRRATPYAAAGTKVRFDDRLFDARPDRLDFRDLPYRPPLRSLPPSFPSNERIAAWLPGYVRAGLILDQGSEGACTGFGLACVVNYLLWVRRVERESRARFHPVSPRMLYELARRYDEWPGEDYEGSSCRGALKGWHKHGVCSEDLWPYTFDRSGKPVFARPKDGWETDAASRTLGVYYRVDRRSVVDLQAAIAEIGAVFVSAQVHDGWDRLLRTRAGRAPRRHDDVPDIERPKNPGRLGGHAFALVGFDDRGFIVQNSWGREWGASGFGRLAYDDWIKHATDAWACALGVPVPPLDERPPASRWPVPSGWSLASLSRDTRAARNPSDDPWPFDHPFDTKAYEPMRTGDAYRHTLVTGNNGKLSVRDFTRGQKGTADYAREIVVDNPLQWLSRQPRGPVRLAIYAHGGLNSEEESIRRVRVLAPYFEANGVYPLFLTWRTGLEETLFSTIEDWIARIPGAGDERTGGRLDWFSGARDRAVESVGRIFGRGVWSEMRENACASIEPGHGLDLTASNLALLAGELGKHGRNLEVHLVGHSAGSILLGHLLERLSRDDLARRAPRVATATLFAAACSVRFALEHYGRAADAGLLPLDRLWLYALSDENEKKDGLPKPGAAAYGKSLLYLVSRALDDVRKMPLLGMERALVPGYHRPGDRRATDQWDEEQVPHVQQWQRRWAPEADRRQLRQIVDHPTVRNTRAGDRVQATHGAFDNDVDALTATIERIAGRALIAPMEWLDY